MLDWFTTIPGILILCGVVLLIIAVVLFVAGAKKNKKEGKNINPVTTNEESSIVPDITNMEDSIIPPVVDTDIPVVPPVEEIPTVSVEEAPSISTSEVVSPISTVSEINPILDSNQQADNSDVSAASFEMPEVKPVTIYGGNDPLEATQSIPKMEEHHEPYGGALNEATIVEPTVNEVNPIPVEDTVSIPEVQEETANEPTVEEVTSTVSVGPVADIPNVAPTEEKSEEITPEVTTVSEPTVEAPQENEVEEL